MTLIINTNCLSRLQSALRFQKIDIKAFSQFNSIINRHQCKTCRNSYHFSNNINALSSHVLNKNSQGLKLNHQNPCLHSGWYTSKRWKSLGDPDKEEQRKAYLVYGSIAVFTFAVLYGQVSSFKFLHSFDVPPKKPIT